MDVNTLIYGPDAYINSQTKRCVHFDKSTFYMKRDYEKKTVCVDLTKVKFISPIQPFDFS